MDTSFARGEDAAQVAFDMVKTGQAPKMERGKVIPRFFIHRVAKADGTLQEMECVELLLPGDTKTSPIKKVTDGLKQLYAPEYEAFKMNKPMEQDGVSLDLWLGRDDPRIRELNHLRIFTVEQMAEISDTVAQGILGAMTLRDKAKEFVERRSGSASLAEENNALKSQMEAMQKQMDGLTASMKGGNGAAADVATHPSEGARDGAVSGLTVKKGFQCFKVLNAAGEEVFTAPTKAECAAWKVEHETGEKGE